jgi:serine/threonine protein kinase
MTQPRMIAERYEVLAEIGRGGMGVVARAFDHRLQTEVAIKILRRDLTAGSAETDSLIKEARVLARLTHSAVVRLFDLAETELGLMLVLEYVRGPNLAQVLKARSRLNETELIFVMRQICAGLDAAHAEGIVHRDLKPPNLLVSADPDAWEFFKQGVCTSSFLLNSKVKITDFGISKLREARVEATLAAGDAGATWASAGTPSFMSPEQFQGQPSTPATDIYALGVLAYQAISGSLPFSGDTVEALAREHLSAAPKPLQNCSPRINQAILRAMAKAPGERFSSAGAFLAALEGTAEAATGLPTWEPDPLDRIEAWAKSYKFLLLCLCLGLLAIPVGAFFWLLPSKTDRARAFNTATAEPVPPNLGKRLNLPVDLDIVPEIKSLPAASPVPAQRVHPGPHHPRISWTALIDTEYEQTPWVDGVGKDGTIYIREDRLNSLWAIRDGVLRWGYRASRTATIDSLIDWQSHIDFRDPGRVWLAWCPDRRLNNCGGSVFNAAGAGGHTHQVPSGFGLPARASGVTMPFFESDAQNWRWPDREGRILCTSRLNAVSLTDQDKGWTVPLDGRATFGVDHGETLIVSTHHGTIYGIDKRGEIRWTFNAGAEVENLQILPSGDPVILEKGRESVACIRAGKLLWKYKSDGLVAEFEDHPAGVRRFAVADTESTLYFSTESGSSTTFALDRNGKLLWKLPWADYVMNPGLSLDSRGRLFFNFQSYQIKKLARAGVLCVSDRDW